MSATSAFRDAAALLINQAPIETVKAILRLLLDSEATDSAATAPGTTATIPRTMRPPARPDTSPASSGRKPATRQIGIDAGWEQLRHEVRAAMRERGVNYADPAAAIGRSPATTKINVSRRIPASGPVQAELRAWLAQAAEVATPALPFRGGRGNGATAVGRIPAADAPASTA